MCVCVCVWCHYYLMYVYILKANLKNCDCSVTKAGGNQKSPPSKHRLGFICSHFCNMCLSSIYNYTVCTSCLWLTPSFSLFGIIIKLLLLASSNVCIMSLINCPLFVTHTHKHTQTHTCSMPPPSLSPHQFTWGVCVCVCVCITDIAIACVHFTPFIWLSLSLYQISTCPLNYYY